MNEAIADGLRRRQNMLSDFNKAQDLLKGKINEITNERDDFEQKYLNRDSRPEDTEMIEHLNVSFYSIFNRFHHRSSILRIKTKIEG